VSRRWRQEIGEEESCGMKRNKDQLGFLGKKLEPIKNSQVKKKYLVIRRNKHVGVI
jgi:hypothetical protein